MASDLSEARKNIGRAKHHFEQAFRRLAPIGLRYDDFPTVVHTVGEACDGCAVMSAMMDQLHELVAFPSGKYQPPDTIAEQYPTDDDKVAAIERALRMAAAINQSMSEPLDWSKACRNIIATGKAR